MRPDDEPHVTGTVLDGRIGVSRSVLEMVEDSVVQNTRWDTLAEGQFGGSGEHRGVDCAGVV